MKILAKFVYAGFGVLALFLGLLALFWPAAALPPDSRSAVALHLVQEQGAQSVFMGLMAFWCLTHFAGRRPVHIALLLFGFLFAAIHWFEYLQGHRHLLSPILNSIPFVLFVITAPWSSFKSESFVKEGQHISEA